MAAVCGSLQDNSRKEEDVYEIKTEAQESPETALSNIAATSLV